MHSTVSSGEWQRFFVVPTIPAPVEIIDADARAAFTRFRCIIYGGMIFIKHILPHVPPRLDSRVSGKHFLTSNIDFCTKGSCCSWKGNAAIFQLRVVVAIVTQ